jgi:mono/diheme cytochrome c family protein
MHAQRWVSPVERFASIDLVKTRNVLLVCGLAGALAACPAKHPSSPQAGAPVAVSDAGSSAAQLGERIYNGNCVPCHQQTGAGIPGVYPTLVGSPVVLGDPGELAQWVLKGQRPPSMPAGRYPTQMLQFGWMKPADAAALFTYLRSNFGNSAPPVDAAAVAKALGP